MKRFLIIFVFVVVFSFLGIERVDTAGTCVFKHIATDLTKCEIVDSQALCLLKCADDYTKTPPVKSNYSDCKFTDGEKSCVGKSTEVTCICKKKDINDEACSYFNGTNSDCQTFDKNEYSSCSIFDGTLVECTEKITGVKTDSSGNELAVPSNLGELKRMGDINPRILIARAIQLLMRIIGTIALLMFVYGGVLWMISAGNTEKTKKAMDIMLWASLGVIVILASYSLVDFVFKLF